MKIEIININDIKEYENNAKLHPAEQIEQIKKSIEEFGNNDPIAIDENNIIIEGHGRYIALQELGYKEVEVIRLNHLTEEQKKAYMLVHNKLTMNTDFDFELLSEELENILDIEMCDYGFELVLDEEEEEKEEVEIEFTESLEEEHNYIVLYFDNNIDWLQAETLFDIKQVKEFSTRKDGTIKKDKKGIGRVINGARALNKLTEGYFNEDKY